MGGIDATKETFESVTVLDKPMLFTCARIDRDTVPKGMYLYEVRHDDDQRGDPVQIARFFPIDRFVWRKAPPSTTPIGILTRKRTGITRV